MIFHATRFTKPLLCSRCLKALFTTCKRSKSYRHWKATAVRSTFLDFFCKKYDHVYVPASSVIPQKDEGTYFTNAGMNQFKPIFLGTADPEGVLASYTRVANSQKCVRVGGKHNDLDDVGKDFTHHTFFEMLGNWSFGHYFKTEACRMALELLTEVYHLPLDRLYFTYFGGDQALGMLADLETKDIWLSLGVSSERVLPFGMRDNFWDMGQTGPCGPCTEIHYDHIGNRNASYLVNADSPEVVEIWNLVFMQFNRNLDQTLTPLPKNHVDTGMGLERICAVLQNSMSNYDTDLFVPIFDAIVNKTKGTPYKGRVGPEDDNGHDTAYRVVADHIRMMTVCISDGLNPGRTEQSHRLRTVMTKCIQQAQVLGMPPGSLSELVDVVEMTLGNVFPEIKAKSQKVKDVINQSEDWYKRTFELSTKAFNKFLKKRKESGIIQGEEAYHLFEGRYGAAIPEEILINLAQRAGLTVDMNNFQHILNLNKASQAQDILVVEKTSLSSLMINELESRNLPPTDDSHKYMYSVDKGNLKLDSGLTSTLLGIIKQDKLVDNAKEKEDCIILLNKTMFYAEGGGQISDTGLLRSQNGIFKVTDVQKSKNYVIHIGHVIQGSFQTGDILQQEIDKDVRLGCMRNHTATHLLNACLRKYLPDVVQMGSTVKQDKFTFDFSCQVPVKETIISQVEDDIAEVIQRSCDVERRCMLLNDALQINDLITLPNESYPSEVNVIEIGDASDSAVFSRELCCGTHVHNTGDIKEFCIINLSGVAQGTKRVIGVTGSAAVQAKEKGKWIANYYDSFEEDVKYDRDHTEWRNRIKQLYTMISDDTLPKTTRDQMRSKVDQIRSSVSTKLNQIEVKSLTENLNSVFRSYKDTDVIVHRLHNKKSVLVQKAMYDVNTVQPAVCLVENGQSLSAIFCLPQGVFSSISDKLQFFITKGNVALSKSKTKNDKIYCTVTFKRVDPDVSYEEELRRLLG